jgi:hypothetical protein
MELVWAADALPDCDIVGVLCGSDGGLADAERLQDVLVPARSNGRNPARRDKFLMLEAMRSAGLDAPMQAAPASWEEARSFLASQRYPVVLKPRRGQASVLVGLAHDEAGARRMDSILRDAGTHTSIDTSELAAGDENVLIQEYVGGDEWVVDTVSAAGEHKVLALWQYDKGTANGGRCGASECAPSLAQPRPTPLRAHVSRAHWCCGAQLRLSTLASTQSLWGGHTRSGCLVTHAQRSTRSAGGGGRATSSSR